MAVTRKSPSSIVKEELIESRVHDVFAKIVELSESLRPNEGDARAVPDFSDLLKEDLRNYFEDEVIPAVPSPSDGDLVDASEMRREIAKKALLGLRVSTLRRAAAEAGVQTPAGSRAEDLAEVVAKALGWDPDEVARFVLENEEDPTQGASNSSRLFVLASDSAGVDDVEANLRSYLGRYIRVGVAKWYVFSQCRRIGPHGAAVSGTYMSYTTSLEERDGEVTLRPEPKHEKVDVEIFSDQGIVEVGNSSVRAAKAAVFASTAVLELRTLEALADSESGRVTGQVHGSSIFFLDLLEFKLPEVGIDHFNLMVARFKIDGSDAGSDAPALKAVRFEGNHLLDSSQACRLIVNDGRPLVNISFKVTLPRSSDGGVLKTTSTFLVKVGIEKNHVLVTTGMGDDPARSGHVHDLVKSAVWAAILRGSGEQALSGIISRMAERAEAKQPPPRPSMLSIDLQRSSARS